MLAQSKLPTIIFFNPIFSTLPHLFIRIWRYVYKIVKIVLCASVPVEPLFSLPCFDALHNALNLASVQPDASAALALVNDNAVALLLAHLNAALRAVKAFLNILLVPQEKTHIITSELFIG